MGMKTTNKHTSTKTINKEDPFQRVRHARYFEDDVLYHIIFRTSQGCFFLKPDSDGKLKRLIAGIIGHARGTFPEVRIHAAAILSNHAHLAISGKREKIAPYIGFIKREISRRWGPVVNWHGLFEESYHATAVITPEAQIRCMSYILSQGVKEGLVEKPQQWPGFHCATSLVTGKPIKGEWLNSTEIGQALRKAKQRGDSESVRKENFLKPHKVYFDKLPALEHLSDEAYRQEMVSLVECVVEEGRKERKGKGVVGVKGAINGKILMRSEAPEQPWFEERRRMVVWDKVGEMVVREYLHRYWEFQIEFRKAANRWRDGDPEPGFPIGAYWPGRARPVLDKRKVEA